LELFTFYYVRTFTLQSNIHKEHAEIFVFIRAAQSCQPQNHATGIFRSKSAKAEQIAGFIPYRMLHDRMLQDSFQRGYEQIRLTSSIIKAIKIAVTRAQNLAPQVMRN